MKTILHLCADLGSDSFPYQQSESIRFPQLGQFFNLLIDNHIIRTIMPA